MDKSETQRCAHKYKTLSFIKMVSTPLNHRHPRNITEKISIKSIRVIPLQTNTSNIPLREIRRDDLLRVQYALSLSMDAWQVLQPE